MSNRSRENYHLSCAIGLFITVVLLSQLSERQFVIASPRDKSIIETWAHEFGDELYDLAQKMTKSSEIRKEYEVNNARIKIKKDQDQDLMANITKGLERMLKLKINAVRCIVKEAEESHKNFTLEARNITLENQTTFENLTYYSSKYSNVTNMNITNEWSKHIRTDLMRPMSLEQDTHFYNISVNITHSSVHVPVNIYDRSARVLKVLEWSESLDTVFVDNYKADPALSWQYFGSETGILRHFPAKLWSTRDTESTIDVYDCRKRSWYIETATCSKDVVILLDNSGSMYGFRNFLAQLTIKSILDTLSNNDFVNIYLYSDNITAMIPCFNDSLVQATPENIEVFNEAAKYLKQQGYINERNITNALNLTFNLLKKYRGVRKCAESEAGCNQAIMLITDGVPANLSLVLDVFNIDSTRNDTHKPVRIFTYLLGKEVTKTLDEVQGEVLKYVSNIAAPLVLQAKVHPPTWTHAFKDVSYEEEMNTTKPRLMIAVGVPAFNTVERDDGLPNPDLLGVASTDVPIDDIEKMALPYKLGVNGYAFIVSNNGYVLLHPDLKPNVNSSLRAHNYNSIDLTEVEQFNDGQPPRVPGELLKELRDDLVYHEKGQLLNVSVKFHYDNRKRVAIQNYDYYYAPLPETPFSLGFAIPSGYGSTFIKVGDEVRKTLNMGIKLSNYFVGGNWKLHPEWVYCKYHYLEGHEFDNPEIEFSHFLEKLQRPTWEWSDQYDSELDAFLDTPDEEPDCGRKNLDDDAYYCNKELVQLLIFDAKVTNKSYGQWKFRDKEEENIIRLYNASLRYVATMSGLTRWQFIFGEDEVEDDMEFGDFHNTAVDETWYKAAVLQHEIDSRSFVYHVPHNAIPDSDDGILRVTASHAIFPHDGNIEAPGCVVGFQFNHDLMVKRFKEITTKEKCGDCVNCNNLDTDCYVIDNNGYVIVSINHDVPSTANKEVGRFFGEIQGDVMQALVDMQVFEMITVYDYQALCEEFIVTMGSAADIIITPFKIIWTTFKLMTARLFFYLSRANIWVNSTPFDEITTEASIPFTIPKCEDTCELKKCWNDSATTNIETTDDEPKLAAKADIKYRACDKKSNLYILQQNQTILEKIIQPDSITDCYDNKTHHPFLFKLIPSSNLMLIVMNKKCGNRAKKIVSAEPEEIRYEKEFPCYKLNLNNLTRRRLEGCFTEHEYEGYAEYGQTCKGIMPKSEFITLIISTLTLVIYRCLI